MKFKVGDKFNKLTVLEKTNQRINRSIIYKCISYSYWFKEYGKSSSTILSKFSD